MNEQKIITLRGSFEGIGDEKLDSVFAKAEQMWELVVEDRVGQLEVSPDQPQQEMVVTFEGPGTWSLLVKHPRYTDCVARIEVSLEAWQAKSNPLTGNWTNLELVKARDSQVQRVITDDASTPTRAISQIANYTASAVQHIVREPHGPIERTKRRAALFKKLKDEDLSGSQEKVALLAMEILDEAGELDPGELITGDDVGYAYRVMGWKWERANRVR